MKKIDGPGKVIFICNGKNVAATAQIFTKDLRNLLRTTALRKR